MTGYHYTTFSAWLKMRKEGLIPQHIESSSLEIDHLLLDGYMPTWICGNWVWERSLKGLAHLGNIIRVLSTKGETKIVKLKIKYEESDRYRSPAGDTFSISAHGSIGDWHYNNGTPADLIGKTIPPSQIEILEVYDLKKLLRWRK